jgi:chromosome partitioning protein
MRNQLILGIMSEAGGVGKTTIAVNVAYEWASRGHSVVILDLDANHSLEDFVSLPENREENETIIRAFEDDFQGNWSLQTPFEEDKFQVCQGHTSMIEVIEKLMTRMRREYILSKLLKQYPLPHQLVILDCSAGLDLMAFNVLSASTHLLIPLDMGVKVKTAARLVQGLILAAEQLELQPTPKILGLVPNRYNKGAAIHEEFIKELPVVAKSLQTKLYPPIRIWQHLNNSAVFGVPLKKMRQGDPVCRNFSAIVDDLETQFHQLGEVN